MAVSNASSTTLTGWFDRLVKNKMAAMAAAISGIAVACFLLTFAKLFNEWVYLIVTVVGLVVLAYSAGLFIYAITKQVTISSIHPASRQSQTQLQESSAPAPAPVDSTSRRPRRVS